MPSKSTKGKATQALSTIPKEFIDQFFTGLMRAEAVNAAFMALKESFIERALCADPLPKSLHQRSPLKWRSLVQYRGHGDFVSHTEIQTPPNDEQSH